MGNNKSNLAPAVLANLTQKTAFTSAELKSLYRQYKHDCNQNGHGHKLSMNKSEFIALYKDIFPKGDASKFAEHIFRTYDKDCNGFLNFKEFITVLNIQLKGTYEDKLTWLFDLYDIDRSDEISYDEAYDIITVLFDLDSGSMPDETNNSAKELTEYLFQMADEHRHGKVDRQFFYSAATRSKVLRHLLVATTQCANHPFNMRTKRSVSISMKNRKSTVPESDREQSSNYRNRSLSTASSLSTPLILCET